MPLYFFVIGGSQLARSAKRAANAFRTAVKTFELYAVPEDHAETIGELAAGDVTTPIGETQVGGGEVNNLRILIHDFYADPASKGCLEWIFLAASKWDSTPKESIVLSPR